MNTDATPVVHATRFPRVHTSRPISMSAPGAWHPGPDVSAARIADDALSGVPGDPGFRSLCAAFRATGGTARGDDLARLLEDQRCGDFVTLAKLIVSNDVFAFAWRDALWVPMFQFELRDLSVRPGPRRVLAELRPVFDGWALAAWFAKRNAWLNDRCPVDTVASNLMAVLEAARADRFVANG